MKKYIMDRKQTAQTIGKSIRNFPWFTIWPFAIVFILCLINGWFMRLDASFSPINGTYQNYNVWKRVMRGENIFSDFTAFYGAGQTLVGAFVTWILGGTYADCQEAAHFLTMFFFSAFAFAVIYCVVKNAAAAIYTTMLIDVVNILRPAKIMTLLSGDIVSTLDLALWNNNAKMIRAGVVPVICLINLAVIWYGSRKKQDLESYRFHLFYARLIGACGGLYLLWENCMGISTYFTFSFLWFLLMMKYYHKELKRLTILVANYVANGIICFFLFLAVATRGDIVSYFSATLSSGSNLAWYYNNGPKILKTIHFSINFWIVSGGIVCYLYIYKMLKEDKFESAVKDLILASVFLGGIFANYFYAWGSGGSRCDNVILAVFFIVIAHIVQCLKKVFFRIENTKMTGYFLGLFSLSIGLMLVYGRYQANYDAGRGVFFESLGGYVSDSVAEDLQIGEQTIGDGTLFSTYSTAVDVLVDEFQPSGFDYIIHVIGEGNQKKYIEAFQESQCDYVQTVHSEYSAYQIWERNQDWFFYKELYRHYVPYTMNSWSTYWRRSNPAKEVQPDFEATIDSISAQESCIKITSEFQEPFIVDVNVKYHTDYPRGILPSQFLRNMVKVTDITNLDKVNLDKKRSSLNYTYLPAEGNKEIPVTVVNGYGEIRLSSFGGKGTELYIDELVAGDIYTTPYRYVHCVNLTDSNWTKGIRNSNEGMLLLSDDALNQACLTNAVALKNHDGDIVEIQSIESTGNGYLHVTLSDPAKAGSFGYPNMFEIIRNTK